MTRQQKEKRKDRIYTLSILIVGFALITVILLANTTNTASAETNTSIKPSAIAVEPSKTVETPCIPVVSDVTTSASPSPESIETPAPRYGFTEDDIYLLSQLLCGSKDISGDGEYDIDGAININYYETSKVLSVVMNRVRSGVFPDTVYDVVMQTNPRQFAVMPANSMKIPSEIALQVVRDWCEAYDSFDPGVQVCPEDHLYFSGNGRINITR